MKLELGLLNFLSNRIVLFLYEFTLKTGVFNKKCIMFCIARYEERSTNYTVQIETISYFGLQGKNKAEDGDQMFSRFKLATGAWS